MIQLVEPVEFPAVKNRKADRHANKQRRSKLYSAPFVAWDGEGITYDGDVQQSYVLFGNSRGDYLAAEEGKRITTTRALAFLAAQGEADPHAIHVVFSMGYDVNMILADLTVSHLRRLWRTGRSFWQGHNGHIYNLEYRQRKTFRVVEVRACQNCGYGLSYKSTLDRRPCEACPARRSIRLWDVWGFFQSSFLSALRKWNIGSAEQVARIEAGKANRGEFTFAEFDTIVEYWQDELRLTVDLMEEFRSQIQSVGFALRRWDGPGAVAAHLYKQHGTKSAMAEIPKEVQEATQHAYSGGRIEQYKFGNHDGRVYVYDINSAYPAGIAQLPRLSGGRWNYRTAPGAGIQDVVPFGVYRLRIPSTLDRTRPAPVWWRASDGSVNYTRDFVGWYWSPEAKIALEQFDGVTCDAAYEFTPSSDDLPFSWVQEMYDQRRQWKKEGNPGERVLKLGLNSLYGKMAQHNGWKPSDGNPPPFHQLQWAGWVTSHTRAQLLAAMLAEPEGIIGVETDSILTTSHLDLDIGPALGQWSESVYDGITYVQAGVYWLKDGERWTIKSRGFDPASLKRDDVIAAWANADLTSFLMGDDPEPWFVPVRMRRFIGMGTTLATGDWPKWRSWQEMESQKKIAPVALKWKRKAHVRSVRLAASSLQPTRIAHGGDGELSDKHKLPWLDGMPAWYYQDEHFVATTSIPMLKAWKECDEGSE